MGGTRPDIAQAVNTTAKYCAAPTEQHMTAGKRIIRYLKKTKDLGIAYTRKPTLDLIGYSDADYAGDRDDRHSTSGNLFMMCGGAITWLSKKHIDVRYHYTREAAEQEIIKIDYCPTDQMIADVLTKPLPRERFEKLREMMGMMSIN